MEEVKLMVASFAVGVLCGFILGLAALASDWKRDAVRNGKAEYYLDKNHKKQWRWKK